MSLLTRRMMAGAAPPPPPPPDGTYVVESFEEGNLNNYTGRSSKTVSGWSIVTSPVFDGVYALQHNKTDTSADGQFRSGMPQPFYRGSKARYYVRFATNKGDHSLWFGVEPLAGPTWANVKAFGVALEPPRNQMRLQETDSSGTTTFDTVSVPQANWPLNEWLRVEIDWNVNNTITADVYDASDTLIGSLSGTSTANISQIGIGWFANAPASEQRHWYADYLRVYEGAFVHVFAGSATGGTVTDVGGWRYHTFTADGTFEVAAGDGNAEALLVAGGGSGGFGRGGGGGGGGAGGVVPLDRFPLKVGSYAVTVGAGADGVPNWGRGIRGGNSILTGNGYGATAWGGGGGAASDTSSSNEEDALDGGSGGGGSGSNTSGNWARRAYGARGQGFDGGDGRVDSSARTGGGGGGTSQNGGGGTASKAGDGGDGIEWPAGSSDMYGGGGGGSSWSHPPGAGGDGGGGGGSDGTDPPVDGTANTGGGGGGTDTVTDPALSGAGGSGIVIIRYPIPD